MQVKYWIDRIVADWPFKSIIPTHFGAPVSAGPLDFKAAFAFLNDLSCENSNVGPILSLYLSTILGRDASYFPPDDMKTLSSLDEFLVSVGAWKNIVSGRKRWACICFVVVFYISYLDSSLKRLCQYSILMDSINNVSYFRPVS